MKRVVIIGNGAAAATIIYNLCRQSTERMGIVVVGENPLLGTGMAYGTTCPKHLLNVPVGKISAVADDSDHFFNWLSNNESHLSPILQSFDRGSFVPRTLYAQYLNCLAKECVAQNQQVSLEEKQARAVGINDDTRRLSVLCSDGETLVCDHVVLAMGNRSPKFPPRLSNLTPIFAIANPWDNKTDFSRLAYTDTVLLLGTGLTAVDILVKLRAEGFTGKVVLFSRHGLLPQAHQPHEGIAIDWGDAKCTPRMILRTVRQKTKNASGNWRGVIDSLRPHTQRFWLEFSPWHKRQFLRHLRTYWDTHRHRMAKSVANFMENEFQNQYADVIKGRLLATEETNNGLDIRYVSKLDKGVHNIKVALLVNCTGSDFDWRDDTLTSSLFHNGLAQPGSLGLGLLCNQSGQLLDYMNQPNERVHALGSLLAGTLWESTAMPELRVQARDCAARICS